MKPVKLFLYFSLLTLFAFTCTETRVEEDFAADYEIKFGTECGWCAGQEYIIISGSTVQYLRNIPCGDEKGETKKSRELTQTEWNELTSSFSYDLFFTLEYNDCNVCVDGCDEIIKISDSDKVHELRYTPLNEVEGMEILKTILNGLMQEMREQ